MGFVVKERANQYTTEAVTERNSDYLRILREQRHPEYDFIKKEYLRHRNHKILSQFGVLNKWDLNKIKRI
jgi:hypothetical protein